MQRENWFMSDKISSKMQFPLRGKRQKRGFELVILNVKCAGMGRGRTEIAEGENIELAAAIFAHNVQRDDLNWENC